MILQPTEGALVTLKAVKRGDTEDMNREIFIKAASLLGGFITRNDVNNCLNKNTLS